MTDIEHKLALSRERNARYLAKLTPEQKAGRLAASRRYQDRLRSNPERAGKLASRNEKARARMAAWAKANPERAKENAKRSSQKWEQENRHKSVAKVQRRNAAKLKATPAWANHAAIDRVYASARYLTEITGHVHHVDHIIPLQGKTVCGLHVENNLRAIPCYLNLRKSNKLEL